MVVKKLRLGTRSSLLALKQAELVKEKIEKKYDEIEIEIIKIKTYGDKLHDKPLRDFNKNDMFVKKIEESLLRGEIDIAVHSMKDIPADIPKGLEISAVTKRVDPRDVFISKNGNIDSLSKGSVIGTSSLRRKAQIL